MDEELELFETFHENGSRKRKGFMRNWKKEGKWSEWSTNGQLISEGEYLEDTKIGAWSEWSTKGQLLSNGEYKLGKKNGKWTFWYENGNKFKEGHFLEDNAVGSWLEWHEDGSKSEHGLDKNREKHAKRQDKLFSSIIVLVGVSVIIFLIFIISQMNFSNTSSGLCDACGSDRGFVKVTSGFGLSYSARWECKDCRAIR